MGILQGGEWGYYWVGNGDITGWGMGISLGREWGYYRVVNGDITG